MNLENLTKEEGLVLIELLKKAFEDKPQEVQPQEVKKKRGRPKKEVKNEEVPKKPSVIVLDADISEETIQDVLTQVKQDNKPVKKSAPKSIIPKSTGRVEVDTRRPPIIESITIGPQKNKFDDMLKNMNINKSKDAKDRKIDALLIGDNEKTPRMKKTYLNDVECSSCNCLYDNVDPLFCTREDGKNYFVCEDCTP